MAVVARATAIARTGPMTSALVAPKPCCEADGSTGAIRSDWPRVIRPAGPVGMTPPKNPSVTVPRIRIRRNGAWFVPCSPVPA